MAGERKVKERSETKPRAVDLNGWTRERLKERSEKKHGAADMYGWLGEREVKERSETKHVPLTCRKVEGESLCVILIRTEYCIIR